MLDTAHKRTGVGNVSVHLGRAEVEAGVLFLKAFQQKGFVYFFCLQWVGNFVSFESCKPALSFIRLM